MRAFILLIFLATALAAPQGYNYPQQVQQQQQQPQINVAQESQGFLQEALRNTKLMQSLLAQSQNAYSAGTQSYYQQQQQPQQQQQLVNGFSAAPQIGISQQQFAQGYNRPAAPVVTKDIYVHVAPEEPEERYAPGPQLPPPPPRKHYRIVFIKAPAPKVSAAELRLKQSPVEEKTIIYVLTKRPDPLELQSALQDVAPKQPSKPEVYFIKYKTQEEAAHAQRTIQAQYDQLGGTTQVSDEGVAPVTSVIGAFDQQSSSGGANLGPSISTSSSAGGGSIAGSGSASSKYLPPIVRL